MYKVVQNMLPATCVVENKVLLIYAVGVNIVKKQNKKEKERKKKGRQTHAHRSIDQLIDR